MNSPEMIVAEEARQNLPNVPLTQQQEARSLIPEECLDDLLGGPLCSWIRGDGEVDDALAMMSQAQKMRSEKRIRSGLDPSWSLGETPRSPNRWLSVIEDPRQSAAPEIN